MQTIRAKKSLGQNFLTDTNTLEIISHATEITGRNIIEVGPGYGALTEYLIEQNPARLDLVELDTDMIHILAEHYGNTENLTIHHRDVLKFLPEHTPYSIVANIPYYITSPILFRFLYEVESKPDIMVILMQYEVGDKILAKKGKKTGHSALSLAMHLACQDISFVTAVPRTAFSPAPKVDSIVLKFTLRSDRDVQKEKILLDLWKQAFQMPRKTLRANLRGSIYEPIFPIGFFEEFGYTESVRAEAIEFSDWERIYNEVLIFCESLR